MTALCLSISPIVPTLAMLVALTGCAVLNKQHVSTATTAAPVATAEKLLPVVRYGRYNLLEMQPQHGQLDLSQQIVDVAMPAAIAATVGEGMQYLLQRTGYSLCQSEETQALYTLPLPAPHLHIGPQTLRDALQLLAGPAWRLTLDQGVRQACFIPSHKAAELTFIGAAP